MYIHAPYDYNIFVLFLKDINALCFNFRSIYREEGGGGGEGGGEEKVEEEDILIKLIEIVRIICNKI